MNANLQYLVIGGLIPALLFGITGIFTKASTQLNISVGHYLIFMGGAACLVGFAALMFLEKDELTMKASIFAFSAGLCWALGGALVTGVLIKYNASIGQLATVYNMNTLVTVVLGLIIFSEWKDVSAIKLLAGSVLVVAGGAIVASA